MKKIHFMGIGGSGANAAAGIAHGLGYQITGCDAKESRYSKNLESLGIPISYVHNLNHLENIEIVCVSPAFFEQKEKPPELTQAMAVLPVITWQEFVGKELQNNKKVISIAGTKGKSTTTSFIGRALEEFGLDPTVLVGADVKEWQQNFRVGKSVMFVCEADEFYNSFHHYHSDFAVITNISYDHPEFFSSYEDYLESYVTFVKNMSNRSVLILGIDSPGVKELIKKIPFYHGKIVTFGSSDDADYYVREVSIDQHSMSNVTLNVKLQQAEYLVGGMMSFANSHQKYGFSTQITGMHNILNLIPVVILGHLFGIEQSVITSALQKMSLPGRRFDFKGEYRGAKVYDDYAHSPISVKVTLASARLQFSESRIIAVFQPHMYSRTKELLDEYGQAFKDADKVILLPIFASREAGSELSKTVSSQLIGNKIKENFHELDVVCSESIENAVSILNDNIREGDVVINMGAGDNYKVVEMILA